MDKEVFQQISERWGLGRVSGAKRIGSGLQTPKYILTTSKGKFVASWPKISETKTIISKSRKSFLYEMEFLSSLKCLPVPKFLCSCNGEYLERIGGKWVSVDMFLPGREPRRVTLRMAYQLGAFLGEFHRQGRAFRKSLPGRRKFYDLSPAIVKKMYPFAKKQTHPELKRVVDEIESGVLRTRPSRNLPKGPIHVDVKPENELWLGEKLSAVVDFGNFYVDALMIDVGKTLMWNCVKGKRLDKRLARELLKGYESKRKLTKTERAYLPKATLFAIYSHIWVDLYHVPFGYVPESYTLSLVRDFLPMARKLGETGVMGETGVRSLPVTFFNQTESKR